ncbi:MAG TPA: hypothetical protein VNR64_11445, partial [Vicinamibacterales bacterium]|nr:hypothetical protein [Vicinamibacterales bacterium]
MRRPISRMWLIGVSLIWVVSVVLAAGRTTDAKRITKEQTQVKKAASQDVLANASEKITHGRQVFRFDTFGDQAFWGDTLRLHQAIEGAALGGVGPGVSPRTALSVGLKVDIDALPANLVQDVLRGRVNLDDPAVTVTLLKL